MIVGHAALQGEFELMAAVTDRFVLAVLEDEGLAKGFQSAAPQMASTRR